MSDLKEFLANEARRERAGTAERESIRTEWLNAVRELLGQMKDWLRTADEQTVLEIEPTFHRIREPRLGTYEVAGLRISLGTRTIEVEPNSRYSLGSIVGDPLGASIRNGRVDLSAGGQRYMLYRQLQPDGRREWIIVGDRDYIARPLSQSSFEDAIKSLLE